MSLLLFSGCTSFERVHLDPARSATEFEARSLENPGVRSFVALHLGKEATDGSIGWDLDALTLAALYYHPSMDVLRARHQLALAGVKSAGQRPNPTLTVTPGYNFSATSPTTPWMPGVNLDWPIETAGKRGIRGALATNMVRRAEYLLLQNAWQIRSKVRNSLVELDVAQERERLTGSLKHQHDELLVLARRRFESGLDSAQDLSIRSLAAAKATMDWMEAQRGAGAARVQLANHLSVPSVCLKTNAFEFQRGGVVQVIAGVSDGELRDRAMTSRTDLLVSLVEFEASQESLRLQIARQYPDLHLGNGYQYDQGEHKWSLGVTLELPVLNRNQGAIAEARAAREEARASVLLIQSQIHGQLDEALEAKSRAWDAYQAGLALGKSNRDAIQLTEQNFNAGSVDRQDLLLARLEMSSVELLILDALARLNSAQGLIEDAIQQPFPGIQTVQRSPRTPPLVQ